MITRRSRVTPTSHRCGDLGGERARVVGLAACSSGASTPAPAESIPAEGVDDGSTLTLWTRAPLEKQAELLVEAYNDSTRTRSSSPSSPMTTT